MANRPRRLRKPSAYIRGMLKTNKRQNWIKTLKKFQRDKCHWCEATMGDDATVEHLMPLSRGGADEFDNVVAAHQICNQAKGNMTVTEFESFLAASPGYLEKLHSTKARKSAQRKPSRYAFDRLLDQPGSSA